MSLEDKCVRYILGKSSQQDLLDILRSINYMWSRILETHVVLGYENESITVDTSCGSPTLRPKLTMEKLVCTKRVAEGEKAIYIQALGLLEWKMKKLTARQREVFYWRLIDHSQKDGKAPSNRELARMIGIDERTFRRNFRSACEELGLDPMYISNYVVLELEKSIYCV